jgi:hypothetical protein
LKILELLAKFCSILSGALLTFITLMTCYSLIGRNTTGQTIVGDFELTGVATGAAIALFMPMCQFKKANIIVDFFTAKASEATIALLGRHERMGFPIGLHDVGLSRMDCVCRHDASIGTECRHCFGSSLDG